MANIQKKYAAGNAKTSHFAYQRENLHILREEQKIK